MRLKSIRYSENVGGSDEWQFDPFEVLDVNLLVGVNASGKTRILTVIHGLARNFLGRFKPLPSGDFWAVFTDEGSEFRYTLRIKESKVVEEAFSRNGHPLLQRGEGGVGDIYAEEEKKQIKFQTPDTELAVVARRDSIQHPFLERLHQWGSGLYLFPFGTHLGKFYFGIQADSARPVDPFDPDNVVGIFSTGQRKFHQEFVDKIIIDMGKLGYSLEDVKLITSKRVAGAPGNILCLAVKETELRCETQQIDMSQGMFRSLSVIIQINYAILSSNLSCVLIDDIGEGLDFQRSCALIDILVSKAKDHRVQLIMSTNDRFVMNRVPLESWSLIKRTGGHCKIFNYINSKTMFDEFKYTGFSNFDFFKMDFLESGLNEAATGE